MSPSTSLRERLIEGGHEDLFPLVDGLSSAILELREGEGVGKGKEPTATEYFAAVATALDASEVASSTAEQLVQLLGEAAALAHPQVIRSHFARVSASLLRVAQSSSSSVEDVDGDGPENADDAAAARSAIQQAVIMCYAPLLRAHGASPQSWNSPAVLRAFNVLLSASGGSNLKLRRCAASALASVLEASSESRPRFRKLKVEGPLDLTAGFFIQTLSQKECPNALQLLDVLKTVAPYLGSLSLGALADAVLDLKRYRNTAITAASMRCMSSVIQSGQPSSRTSGTSTQSQPLQLSKILRRAMEGPPEPEDLAGATSFAQFVSSCLVRLSHLEPMLGRDLLPSIISTLVGYCEGSQVRVHGAACQAMNLSFQAVVDQSMVSEMMEAGLGSESSQLGRVLGEMQSLLRHKYQRAWPSALPLLGRLFLHLRGASYPILISVLQGLGELRDALAITPSAALPGSIAALDEALGYAIEGVGMEKVLSVLPLRPKGTDETVGVLESRSWLLPLLRLHGKAATQSRLQFFHEGILSIARHCDSLSRSERITPNEKRTNSFRVVQLWQLLPCFCTDPVDLSAAFPTLSPLLANAMKDERYPEIALEVCQSFLSLTEYAKEGGSGESAKSILGEASSRFLPLLYGIMEKLNPEDDGGSRGIIMCQTASALASVAKQSFLSGAFKKLLQKLLMIQADAKPDASRKERLSCIYLDLIAGMTPQLDEECMQLCYRATKPLIRDEEVPAIQKRSYKVLAQMCKHCSSFIISDDRLEEVLELLTDSLLTCHVNVCRARLQCLTLIASALDTSSQAHARAIQSLAGEVVLCTKNSNGRTREAAAALLVVLAKSDPERFMKIVAAAVAGRTPHMRSAGLLALTVLQKEYGHFRSPNCQEIVQALTPELVLTVVILLREQLSEVPHAALGYLRVAIGGLDRSLLEPLLPAILTAIMSDLDPKIRAKYRSLVKVLLKKLCRKFGFAHIAELVPDSDKKLIRSMQKLALRELRQKHNRQQSVSRKGGGSVGEAASQRKERQRQAEAVMVREQEEDDGDDGGVVDLLDGSMVHNLRVADTEYDSDSDDSEGPEIEIGADGKLIMPLDSDDESEDSESPADKVNSKESRKRGRGNQIEEENDEDGLVPSAKAKRVAAKNKQLGGEYRSKKAGGDVLRKGQKFEPYAYLPLDGRKLAMHAKHKGSRGAGKSRGGDDVGREYASLVKRGKRGYMPRQGKT